MFAVFLILIASIDNLVFPLCSSTLSTFTVANLTKALTVNELGYEQGINGMKNYSQVADGALMEATSFSSSWYTNLVNSSNPSSPRFNISSYTFVQVVLGGSSNILENVRFWVRQSAAASDKSTFSLWHDHFEVDTNTSQLIGNVPIGMLSPPLSAESLIFQMGLEYLNPTSKPLTLAAIRLVSVTSVCSYAGDEATKGFVWKKESTLMLRDNPFYFYGWASYSICESGITAMEIEEYLKTVKTFGGGYSAVIHIDQILGVGRSIQPNMKLSNQHLKIFDTIFYYANMHNVKILPHFIHDWGDGGVDSFNGLYGSSQHNDFFFRQDIINGFKGLITELLNRNNTISGVLYKNDPTILAWSLGCNLRLDGDNLVPTSWTREITDHVRSQDPNHLIMDSGLRFVGRYWRLDSLALPNLDILAHNLWNEGYNHAFLYNMIQIVGKAFKKNYVVTEDGIGGAIPWFRDNYFTPTLTADFNQSAFGGMMRWCLTARSVNVNWRSDCWYTYPGVSNDQMKEMADISGVAMGIKSVTESGGTTFPVYTAFKQTRMDAPRILSIESSDNAITVSWFGSIGATGYRLYQSKSNESFSKYFTLTEFQSPYVDSTVAKIRSCPITYYYKLVGRNPSFSLESDPAYFSVTMQSTEENGICFATSSEIASSSTGTMISAEIVAPNNSMIIIYAVSGGVAVVLLAAVCFYVKSSKRKYPVDIHYSPHPTKPVTPTAASNRNSSNQTTSNSIKSNSGSIRTVSDFTFSHTSTVSGLKSMSPTSFSSNSVSPSLIISHCCYRHSLYSGLHGT